MLGDYQGAVLNSSDRGGIRIQYSRNPFGKKRDYDGTFINTPTAATYTAPSYEGQAVAAPAYASTAAAPAAYGSGDYTAPTAAPGVEPQQTNGQPASYEAAAQPGIGHLSAHTTCLLMLDSLTIQLLCCSCAWHLTSWLICSQVRIASLIVPSACYIKHPHSQQ